jgi:hypothetical protein
MHQIMIATGTTSDSQDSTSAHPSATSADVSPTAVTPARQAGAPQILIELSISFSSLRRQWYAGVLVRLKLLQPRFDRTTPFLDPKVYAAPKNDDRNDIEKSPQNLER